MIDVMLDLETLGTGPRAAIVAIGACKFDPRGVGLGPDKPEGPVSTFYRRVSLATAMEHGDVDPSTLLWWMQQSDQARQDTFLGECGGLSQTLAAFNAFVADRAVGVWGNGATFDNVVIRSAMAACGITPAWSFRNDKCYRTVINLLPKDEWPAFERSGTAHNALDDAITQALYLQKIFKRIRI